MKAYQLLIHQLIRSLQHYELVQVLLLIVEGRIRFYGTLMIAIRMITSICISKSNAFFDSCLCFLGFITWRLFKEEWLELDQDCLNCVSWGPTLIQWLLGQVNYIHTDCVLIKYKSMGNGSKKSERRWTNWIVRRESHWEVEDTTFIWSSFRSSQVTMPLEQRVG